MTVDAINLGATLYVPILRSNLIEICNGALPGLRSIVVCLEDSLSDDDVELAKQHFTSFLVTLKLMDSRIIVFVRPRSHAMLRWMLAQPHIDAIDGFVIPKVARDNVENWLSILEGTKLSFMPTIEGAEAFDQQALRRLADTFDRYHPRITAIRIGGNDILGLLGTRRSRTRTAYDGPLGAVIRNMAGVFIPAGFAVSAPVFEHYNSLELLCEEVERDMEHGLFTKTVIHPCQVALVHACYQPRSNDLEEASSILQRKQAVFGMDGSMCEYATHWQWASNVKIRGSIFGIAEAPSIPSIKVA